MRLTIESGDRSLFAHAIRHVREQEPPRTGLHCSSIINDIRLLQESKGDKARDPLPEATSLLFMEMGNLVEDVLAQALAYRIPGWEKPLPRTSPEGIICSPDGYSPRSSCIDEVKVTWKSLKDFLSLQSLRGSTHTLQAALGSGATFTLAEESQKFFLYRLQLFSYMHLWNAERGRLHVCFLNGNYQPPFPQPVTFCIKPEPGEVQAMWDLLVQHARDRKML